MANFDDIKNLHLKCFVEFRALGKDLYNDPKLLENIKSLLKDISNLMEDNKKKIRSKSLKLTRVDKASLQDQNGRLLKWREFWLRELSA